MSEHDAGLIVFNLSALAVRAAIEDGKTVMGPRVYDCLEYKGFGLVTRKDEGKPDPDDFDLCRTENFIWPFPADAAECAAATLTGEPTPEEIGAVETLAIMTMKSRGEGADFILWRQYPTWETERWFDDPVPRHRLRMRGAFAWRPEL